MAAELVGNNAAKALVTANYDVIFQLMDLTSHITAIENFPQLSAHYHLGQGGEGIIGRADPSQNKCNSKDETGMVERAYLTIPDSR
jgi:hypothetical protein